MNVKIENSNIGDLICVKSEVSDVIRVNPLSEEFYVKVIEPLQKGQSNGGTRKPPASNQDGKEAKKPDGYALPKIIEVSKDGRTGHSWEQQSFNEHSALKVKGSEEDGYDFFVNIDNIHLLSELKPAKSSDIQAIQAKYKFGLVLIGLALLNDNNQEQ